MKRNLLVVFCLLFSISGRAQVTACTPSQFILTNYINDGKRLGLAEVYRQQSPYTDSIEIPFSFAYPILEDLQVIYDGASPSPTDTIFGLFPLHAYGQVNVESVLLRVDTNVQWVKSWMNGSPLTGNATVDSLMTKYSLALYYFHNYSWGDSYASIRLTTPYNAYALGKKFQTVTGVLGYTGTPAIGTGYGIIKTNMPGYREYIFEMGWGDCEAGCIYYIRWKFHVNNQCQAQYVSHESNYQDPLVIEEENKATQNFSLSPNPATTQLNITVDEELIGPQGLLRSAELNIYNITGALVQTERLLTVNHQLSTGNLPSGVYIAEVKTKNASVRRRFVKQ